MSSHEVLRTKNFDASNLVQWHLNRILTSIKRKLTLKRSFKNPYQFHLTEPIPDFVFSEIFKVIKDYKVDSGTQPIVHTNTIRNKPGRRGTITNQYIVKFDTYFSLVHHLTHFFNKETNIINFFEKKIKKCNVEVVVTKDKPFILHFKRTTQTVCVTGFFQVINEYGIKCSF